MSKFWWFVGGCVTGLLVAGVLADMDEEETCEDEEESMDDIFAPENRAAVACIPAACGPNRNTFR